MRNILVIRLSSLGDVVLTGPVFQALRQACPDAQITALTKAAYADVLKDNPHLNQCLLLERGESLFSLIRRVRAGHYDTVVDLHSNLRSRLISLFSGAAQIVRYRKAALARRLYVGLRWKSPELEEHTLDRYFQALRGLGIETGLKKLLVIQTAFLGDAVLTLPFLNVLIEKYPGAAVTVLCTPEVAEVFERQPSVEIIRFDKRGRDKGLAALWRVARELHSRNFPLVFLPHRSLKSALLAWLAGIPRRIGFSTSQGRWLLTDVVPFRWGVHDADRNLSLLKAVGVQCESGELTMEPDASAVRRVADRLTSEGITPGDLVLGVNAGSVWPTKRWPAERFAAVADRAVRELGMKVVFFGGPADVATVNRVVSTMHEKSLNWAGNTSLRELIATVSRCSVFLTNDSGPMHIAVACRVPTVAIFGPTTKELGFFPYGPGHIVVEKKLSCRPCGLHGAQKCPLGHFECMLTIEPDEVFKALVQQTAKARSRERKPVTSVQHS